MILAPSSNSLPLCGLVLVSILFQAGFFVFTYIYFTNEIKQLHETYVRNNIVCLMKEDLGDVLQTSDVDKNDPCWAVKTQIQILIKKIIVNSYSPEISSVIQEKVAEILPVVAAEKQSSKFSAAHFTGNNEVSTQEHKRSVDAYHGHKLTGWSNPPSETPIKMQKGELIIPETGYYYVYAQTYFRIKDPEEGRSKQLVQYIYKKLTTYNLPITLMKNVKTTCWSRDAQHELQSIYQGGVFKLNKNDRLFVAASDVRLVDMDKAGTYFGAFQVF